MTSTAADRPAGPPADRPDAGHDSEAPETVRQRRNRRADEWENRLAVPVIVAAAVAVPAVFLTIFGQGTTALVGTLLNWASLLVLTAETVVLFLLTGDRLEWVRRHRWTLAIIAIAIPAVVLALAPAQALRLVVWLVKFVGALRVLRAGRIIKAGRVLARRSGWTGPWRYLPILLGSVVAAVLVGVVLSDQTSTTRQLLSEYVSDWVTVPLALLAGAILAAATFIVLRARNRER